MKVSILIANYNNGKYFEACWNSLIHQSYTNFEIIMVDDCSTDDSVAIIEKITARDERVKFFKNDSNKGCGYTKRRCAELAQGEFLCFVDPDDYLAQSALSVVVNRIQQEPAVALVYSNFQRINEQGEQVGKRTFRAIENKNTSFFNLNGAVSHFALFRKSAYQKTTGINPILQRAVDQDLYLKLYEVGDVVGIDVILYFYRVHGGGISTGNNEMKADFWHWKVILDAADRRSVNCEQLFEERYVFRRDYTILKKELEGVLKSKAYRLAQRINRIFTFFKRS
jgi:glycosyltransferase involved in cell wall biosynthesis